jgi:hypothetical protein
MRGDLVTPPRIRNNAIPKSINDIILRALTPDLAVRYARASDLLTDLLDARAPAPTRVRPGAAGGTGDDRHVRGIQERLKDRDTPQAARFCWHCRKPLHARTDRCPFCNEPQ